jgi:AcrR family transcriptional regulator
MLSTVSPKVADPALRMTLLETAARLIAEDGPGLTLRRLAAEVGTSTMAVYTHFGGMDELRGAVCMEAFRRFADHLDSVAQTKDPVFDLGMLGGAYMRNALTNPNMYRVMFLDPPPVLGGFSGADTFNTLVVAVERATAHGRFAPGDAVVRAQQIWALSHGAVSLHLAGFFDVGYLATAMRAGAITLFIGFGDDPAKARRSMARVGR